MHRAPCTPTPRQHRSDGRRLTRIVVTYTAVDLPPTFPVVRRSDEQRFGEHRTRCLILERCDAMVAAGPTAASRRRRSIRLRATLAPLTDPPSPLASRAN
jgi:hypothetical protein